MVKDSAQTRVAFWDLETSPNIGYTWGKYEQDVIEFIEEFTILSFSVKFSGEKHTTTRALCDYPLYKRNKKDDRALVKELHSILSKADILIAHNGDKFDVKKANTRFLLQNLRPLPPYKTIDTRSLARKYFGFNSNKLDDLAKIMGIGRKVRHEGFGLWKDCMEGNLKAWAKMKEYNSHDVVLLEKIYLKMRGWNQVPKNSPALSCPIPTCGSSHVQSRGHLTEKGKQYQCQNCFKWFTVKVK